MPSKKKSVAPAKKKSAPKLPADPALELATPEQEEIFQQLFPHNFSYDVLGADEANDVNVALRILSRLSEHSKNRPTGFKRLSDIRADLVPLPHFALQHLVGSYGLPKRALIEFIGAESLGKTTLAYTLAGFFMRMGCIVLYIETEAKPMPVTRAWRCLSSSLTEARVMSERLIWKQAFSLPEYEQVFLETIDVLRGRHNLKEKEMSVNIPIDTPIIVITDTWSKLMSAGEAQGLYAYGTAAEEAVAKEKKDLRDTATGSNFEHAKWAQAWSRRLPSILAQNNVISIHLKHQNDKISMSAGGASFMSEDMGALYNKTSRGGRAFNQNASVQLLLARFGQLKSGDRVIGKKVRIRTDKQSFGPENRSVVYNLITDSSTDCNDYLEPALDFDEALADLLISSKLLDVTVKSKRYTSRRLKVMDGTAKQLSDAFHANREIVAQAGKFLRIEGYEDVVDTSLINPEAQTEEKAVETAKTQGVQFRATSLGSDIAIDADEAEASESDTEQ